METNYRPPEKKMSGYIEEIPEQLRGLNFCRVKRNKKAAFQRGWQSKPYTYDDISDYFPTENYGVMTDSVRVLDDDTSDKILLALFENNFGKTFRSRDHYYFKFNDGDTDKIIFYDENDNHMGELQGAGQYVVGPGSKHPDGSFYNIVYDMNIITISKEKFYEVFGRYIKTKPKKVKKRTKSNKDYEYEGDLVQDIPITNVIDVTNMKKTDEGYQGSNPWHGSTTGQNFTINTKDNVWFCHRCNNGAGAAEAIAIKEGFINCDQASSHTLTDEQARRVIEVARKKYGLIKGRIKGRQDIKLPGDNRLYSVFAKELGSIIGPKNKVFYRWHLKKAYEIGKIQHPNGDVKYDGFSEVTPTRLITLIEKECNPYILKDNNGYLEKVYKSMNQNMSSITLESDAFISQLPSIERLFMVPIPIIHNHELSFPLTGYDMRFGSWLAENSPEISRPDMHLEEAKDIIEEMLKEYCWRDEKQDKFNAIAAILTPFLRGLFSSFNVRTPIFIYTANRERSGKDYLAALRGLIMEGMFVEDSALSDESKYSDRSDELRKKITSASIDGRKLMHFSNNRGHLSNSSLEGFSTKNTISDRLLGKNATTTFDNEFDFSLSGNTGLTFTPDLMNRSIFINLFLDIEDANKREFERPNLHGWVLENRELILSALFSLVKNWFNKGRPEGTEKFSSFPEWASICGGIMDAAGWGNPCVKNMSEEGISDPETDDMKTLFELCYELYPNTYMDRKEIVNIITSNQNAGGDIFNDLDLEERSGQTSFWKKFNKYNGRTLSNIKMLHDKRKRVSDRKFRFFIPKKNEKSCTNIGEKSDVSATDEEQISGEKKEKLENIHSSSVALHPRNVVMSCNVVNRVRKLYYYSNSTEKILDGGEHYITLQLCEKSHLNLTDFDLNNIILINPIKNNINPINPMKNNIDSINSINHMQNKQNPIENNQKEAIYINEKEEQYINKKEEQYINNCEDFSTTNDQQKLAEKSGNVGNIGNVIPPCSYTHSPQQKSNQESINPIKKEVYKPQQHIENDNEAEKPKIGSDREVQFWESPETADIVPGHTKDDLLQWIKSNPGESVQTMYDKWNIGSMQYLAELKDEGKVQEQGYRLYGI